MCNTRTISEAITGPATDALERSLKRPRTEKSQQVPSAHDTTFCFPDLYSNLVASVDGIDEAFPSISWSFDDDSDTDDYSFPANDYLQPMAQSLLKCTKIEPSTMRRSKSFRTNLADMTEGPPTFNTLLMFESNLRQRPIRIEDREESTEFLTKTTASPLSRGIELHSLA